MESLKLINVVKQSVPVIRNIVDSSSNMTVALELIENANDLMDKKLSQFTIVESFKAELKESELKAKKKLEVEFLNIVDSYLNSRIQFMESKDASYREEFKKRIDILFTDEKLFNRLNFDAIHANWYFNFVDGNADVFSKLRALLNNLLKVENLDSFLR